MTMRIDTSDILKHCTLCPRGCNVNRFNKVGYCKIGSQIKIARAAPHFWEEPCISGERGSGAIFFSGCSLGCVFCQNRQISANAFGADISEQRFEEICFELRDKGVHNINLVSADHQLPMIVPVLERIKDRLGIPIVYNCSGYQSKQVIDMLSGIVDVYLPDLKFFDPEKSAKYLKAPDYFKVASEAISNMVSQVGKYKFSDGMLSRGVMVRHLVMPSCRRDSEILLNWLVENFEKDDILLSVMAQYTPNGDPRAPGRTITTFEYEYVAAVVERSGFDGYFQERSSAKSDYTPDFDLFGVK